VSARKTIATGCKAARNRGPFVFAHDQHDPCKLNSTVGSVKNFFLEDFNKRNGLPNSPRRYLSVRPARYMSAGVGGLDPEALEAAAVMVRYCDGEAAAFQRLYAMLAPRILGYLTGLTGDKATAEDVLQLAFLKVHEARGTYVRGANPIPWIYTIAHRSCLDEMRKRKRSRVRLTRDGELGAPPAAHITGIAEEAHHPEGERSETAAAAMAALERLPENQREALILTKVHGRSIAEAAMITGTTPGAIKLRAHRAYVTLREVLGRGNRAGQPASKRETA
jgi:RNA polymerase sigma-70 factor (ECF subfamily)